MLLLILAGVLFSIFFRGVAGYLMKWLPIKNGFALGLAVILTAGVLVGLGFILSPSISPKGSKVGVENFLSETIATQTTSEVFFDMEKRHSTAMPENLRKIVEAHVIDPI